MTENQNPEQKARDKIDEQLQLAGWVVQHNKKIDLYAGLGVAVREYPTETGPADYVLFVDRKACGVIEAKREEEGQRLTAHEAQTEGYAAAKLKWVNNKEPMPFLYESTGIITRFTDGRDPKPRSREAFNFHRPETLKEWLSQSDSLRARLHHIPPLAPDKRLRDCQHSAIVNLEESFQHDRPRALIQMATGAGKTYTAITSIYRLLKFAEGKRILFLVNTRNLGEQAEQEMMSYTPLDDNRKFTELYTVQRLKNSFVAKDSQVCISTIQRLYSILKEEELDDAVEDINPADLVLPKKPKPVVYNEKIPPEFFDFIFIDECHESIYNLWQQVLDYFDASLIGLTATPDNRTYGFFRKNVVSEYSHEKAVADGVNVGNEVYVIETQVSKQGDVIKAHQQVERREKLTRKKRWEQHGEDEAYAAKQLDRSVVNPDQIRTIIRTFRDKLPEIFPGREEVPKTLIFAKTDSHADDIIQTVREEFGEGNAFCKKLTYKIEEDPKSVLSAFRNDYYPRIAVTVDMIATGTDVKPLECLLFMRDVKSRNYFEQMKGRGTRTFDLDELKKVTPSTKSAKTHYVIVDAVGVTKSLKTSSQPLITKPTVPFKDLAMGVMLIPGELRACDVEVGSHVAISPPALPRFLKRFEAVYGALGKTAAILATAAAHHRLAWIHPFADGNGRVARLMSHAMLLDTLDTGGAWSISRGLARNVQAYKGHLAACDLTRRNDLDGRGNLSEENLAEFTRFFLTTCIDQVSFMEGLVQPDRLRTRILLWAEEEIRLNHLPPKSGSILEAVLYRGVLPRADAARIVGTGDRQARRVVSALLKHGVLTSESMRAPLRLAFPAAHASRWMPGLFPDKP